MPNPNRSQDGSGRRREGYARDLKIELIGPDRLLAFMFESNLGRSPNGTNLDPNMMPERYAQIRPLLVESVQHLGGNNERSPHSRVRMMVEGLKDKFEFSRDQIEKAQPYIIQFVKDEAKVLDDHYGSVCLDCGCAVGHHLLNPGNVRCATGHIVAPTLTVDDVILAARERPHLGAQLEVDSGNQYSASRDPIDVDIVTARANPIRVRGSDAGRKDWSLGIVMLLLYGLGVVAVVVAIPHWLGYRSW